MTTALLLSLDGTTGRSKLATHHTDTGAFAFVGLGRCNGSLEVFSASLDGLHYGLYSGSDPVADLVYAPTRGGYGDFFLNAEGDFAVVGAGTAPNGGDQNFLFVRSVTPEPSSVALLGTGLLSLAGVVRRRMTVIDSASA